MISEKDVQIRQATAKEEQLTPRNYLTNEKLIIANVHKRKYKPVEKSIFKAVKRIKN